MKLEVISGRLVLSMSNGALIDPKIGEPYASQIVEEFNLAIAPQAPVSAVPVVSVLDWREEAIPPAGEVLAGSSAGLYCVQLGHADFPLSFRDSLKLGHFKTLAEAKAAAQADYEQRVLSALTSPPPPAQADDGRDAEIEHLKLEMDGVDNAKEEIGRLLGLTEEFRWKRISAAIHEQKRLIRELEQAVAFADDNRTFQIGRADRAEALIRELVVALTEFLEFGEYAYSHGREAITK